MDKKTVMIAVGVIAAVILPLLLVSLLTASVSAIPPEVQAAANDWPMANRDYSNTRYTTHSNITSANVRNLALKWSVDIIGSNSFGGAQSNPIILGDTVFFQDGLSNTYSIQLSNGKLNWLYRPNPSLVLGPNGPAVGYGKVYVTAGVYNVAALDIDNGNVVWNVTISQIPDTGIDMQPLVFDDMVYIATVPAIGDIYFRPGGIGMIYALNEADGGIVWQTSTVDSPDLWGHPEINSGGGCWYPPAIDIDSGATFWGTGNPAPFVGTQGYPNGESRPGPNLYTDSIMSLDHRTGTIEWYRQVVPHDLFDYDFEASPILTSGNIGGAIKDLVIGGGKVGKVFAFDRNNGTIIWSTLVGRHQNDTFTALPPGNTTVYPGVIGGIETPMACAQGMVFASYNDLFTIWQPDAHFSGNVSPYIPPYQQGTGGLAAIDISTGQIVWDHKFPAIDVGAATVVNDLVFTATLDGTIYALSTDTGAVVWQSMAPAGITAFPAVAGDTIVWPCGDGFASGGTPTLIALSLH